MSTFGSFRKYAVCRQLSAFPRVSFRLGEDTVPFRRAARLRRREQVDRASPEVIGQPVEPPRCFEHVERVVGWHIAGGRALEHAHALRAAIGGDGR